MWQHLEVVEEQRLELALLKSKAEKSELGQFFTNVNIARFMASMFPKVDGCIHGKASTAVKDIRILDAGAGIGSLSCAYLERLLNEGVRLGTALRVKVLAYEVDKGLKPYLTSNLNVYSKIALSLNEAKPNQNSSKGASHKEDPRTKLSENAYYAAASADMSTAAKTAESRNDITVQDAEYPTAVTAGLTTADNAEIPTAESKARLTADITTAERMVHPPADITTAEWTPSSDADFSTIDGTASPTVYAVTADRVKGSTADEITADYLAKVSTDTSYIPSQFVTASLADIATAEKITIETKVVIGDYITEVASGTTIEPSFTHAILNPPYKKMRSDTHYRKLLRHHGIEVVNLYTAFLALAILQVEDDGHIVAIVPRSFCNGLYYKPFRKFMLERTAIRKLHLFDSRSTAFKDDAVLQENVIIHLEKSGKPSKVSLSRSTDESFNDLSVYECDYERVVREDDDAKVIHIPNCTSASAKSRKNNPFTKADVKTEARAEVKTKVEALDGKASGQKAAADAAELNGSSFSKLEDTPPLCHVNRLRSEGRRKSKPIEAAVHPYSSIESYGGASLVGGSASPTSAYTASRNSYASSYASKSAYAQASTPASVSAAESASPYATDSSEISAWAHASSCHASSCHASSLHEASYPGAYETDANDKRGYQGLTCVPAGLISARGGVSCAAIAHAVKGIKGREHIGHDALESELSAKELALNGYSSAHGSNYGDGTGAGNAGACGAVGYGAGDGAGYGAGSRAGYGAGSGAADYGSYGSHGQHAYAAGGAFFDARFGLKELGIAVSTGPVVDFRLKEHLLLNPMEGTAPLISPIHIQSGKFIWPVEGSKKPNAIMANDETKKVLYSIGYYCVVRRFSSKEEKRRVVASVVDPTNLKTEGITNFQYVGIENHLNVFHQNKQGLTRELAYGLAAYLNTTFVDNAFREFAGSTQVNVSDVYRLKFPSLETLIALGTAAAKSAQSNTKE